jgi:hypothetical protein
MVERRPSYERGPDLQAQADRRQQHEGRDSAKNADADRQSTDQIHDSRPL